MIWDDEDPDTVTVQTEQNLDEVLSSVERDREIMAHNGVNKVIGRPPVTVYERACLERWDERDWSRWWNGAGPEDLPNGRAFRIWNPGGTI